MTWFPSELHATEELRDQYAEALRIGQLLPW